MTILNRPLPFTDIGIDRINELIRNITGGNEDAFQDTWVDILEKKPINTEQIRDIAQSKLKEAISNYIANKYKSHYLLRKAKLEPYMMFCQVKLLSKVLLTLKSQDYGKPITNPLVT